MKSIEITDVTSLGAGIGRYKNKPVFIPYTTLGDVVTFEIIKEKKKFINGRLINVIEPSPHRVEPNVLTLQFVEAVIINI